MTEETKPVEVLGPCCECGADCTERDLVGNGMESDGLGTWPKLWCDNCINKHLDQDYKGDVIAARED